MKFQYICLILAAILLGGCASVTLAGTVTLNQAIQAAAKNIEENLDADTKIALLNFSSPSEQFSAHVLEELSDRLVNGKKLVVVDRRELDLIRQEENFQLSGEVNDESAQAIGRKLGAQLILSGSVNSIGKVYRFRIRMLSVETAAIETSYSADINPKEASVVFLLDGAKPAIAETAPPEAPVPGNMVLIKV